MKRALITGITGQDGSYLAELLLAKGYEVTGLVRRSSSFNTERLERRPGPARRELPAAASSHGAISTTPARSTACCASVKPDEIYNLGAQSSTCVSFDVRPSTWASTVGIGTGCACSRPSLRVLVRRRLVRFYPGGSSSEMLKAPPTRAAGREHAVHPAQPPTHAPCCAPTSCARIYPRRLRHAHLVRRSSSTTSRPGAASLVRDAQDHHAHGRPHSPRPREEAYLRQPRDLVSGDWGFAGDYVEAYVGMISSSRTRPTTTSSGPRANATACVECSRSPSRGELESWIGKIRRDRPAVLFRPTEVDHLKGDPSKAMRVLGWKPKVTFKGLIQMMVRADEEDVRTSLAGRAPTSSATGVNEAPNEASNEAPLALVIGARGTRGQSLVEEPPRAGWTIALAADRERLATSAIPRRCAPSSRKAFDHPGSRARPGVVF